MRGNHVIRAKTYGCFPNLTVYHIYVGMAFLLLTLNGFQHLNSEEGDVRSEINAAISMAAIATCRFKSEDMMCTVAYNCSYVVIAIIDCFILALVPTG